MTSTLVAVLAVTLLLPGLAMLVAVVLRFLVRGAPRRGDDDEPFDGSP
jgi:hypothetical protein